ncbi:TIGR03032 family protein [Lacipirellula parvula]|uniref:Conserved hypothetical protein CHP03032 domain-containing protein n=1 Tax=Lacipirellula parvula TaxID=2650471 RepID=A0A5K7X8Z6_9BACT|nr:TIGR03032 family protein [Lacipirellula parvula]BBO32815.1 hypothetical protein PLANPX_2427 [Lacipirellula parvula]
MPLGSSDDLPQSPPLRSVHTVSFAKILNELASSLLVSTYQAGKLVLLRNEGGLLNTHFRNFMRPMGLASAGGQLAVGTALEVVEFHNVPAACARLDRSFRNEQTHAEVNSEPTGDLPISPFPPADKPTDAGLGMAAGERESTEPSVPIKHDACFLPRRSHTTGDVQIHEMAWIGDELWFVNTAFSCLSTRSDANSFDVRWRPKFIDGLAPNDCCHLNGLAVRDGQPAFVTALGETGVPSGWRENKRDGGVLIDVESNEIVARGLSMPHSPRWHRGELWMLESGDGSFGRVDLGAGRYEPIARLPGFTRGLSLIGPLAFIGLSQVRESAVFSDFPLVERLDERVCGVWVVHIETGATLGFVKFEDAVQEIFAVELLRGMRYPDIVNHDPELIGRSYVLHDDALALVPEKYRNYASPNV